MVLFFDQIERAMVGVRSQRIERLQTEMLNLRNTVLQLQTKNNRMKIQQDWLLEKIKDLGLSRQFKFQRRSFKDREERFIDKIEYFQSNARVLAQRNDHLIDRLERQNKSLKKYLQRKIEVLQQQNAETILQIQLEFQHRIKIAKQQYIEYSQKFYEGHILRLKKSLNKKFEDLGHEQKYSSKASQKKNIQQLKLHKSLSSREIERK